MVTLKNRGVIMSNNKKYRAWDSRNNEFAYSEKDDCFYINTKGVLFMYALPKPEDGGETVYHKSYDVDAFTGMQDVNNVDMYQNDIASIAGIGAVVIDICPLYGVIYKTNSGNWTYADSAGEGDYPTVVGNIFESKELLEF